MTGADRYVVLGLAGVRTTWFGAVARWATDATVPVDFVKVVSGAEARARLASGHRFSALLVDAGLGALDRDLVDDATAQGCAVVVAEDGRSRAAWDALGAAAVLPVGFGPDELVEALRAAARPVPRRALAAHVARGPDAEAPPGGWRGRLVAVTGAGGVGRSTLATALATGLAGDPRHHGLVLLADLALHAHQALLHDAGDVVPGLLELAEAHRTGVLAPHEVRSLCFRVADRGYDLLLGLRRHRDWTALRPRAVAAALDATRRAYRYVVADVDADVEGERECGSADVEDRNVLARQCLPAADLVLVVGVPGVAGLHAQLRVLTDLVGHGVDPRRAVPVVNRAPRSPRRRAELSAALARLLPAAVAGGMPVASPVFVPDRRRLGEVPLDGGPLPPPVVRPVTVAVRGLLDRTPPRAAPTGGPAREAVPVAPGSLGSWSDDGGEP